MRRFWAMVAKRTALIAGLIIFTSVLSPTAAQLPNIPGLQVPTTNQVNNNSDNQVVTSWIRLDGRPLFQIAASKMSLPQRAEDIRQRLQTITQSYFQSRSGEVRVQIKTENNLPVIYVNDVLLLTVTDQDAKAQGEDNPFNRAQRLSQSLEQDIKRAKRERQPAFLRRQGGIAAGIFLGVVITSWGVHRWYRRLKRQPVTDTSLTHLVTTQLRQQRQQNLQEVRQRLFQLAQSMVWGSGALIILGLFAHTRIVQVWILTVLRIPFTLAVVGLMTYVTIRLSYVLIDQFTAALANNTLLTPEDSLRLQARVSTISSVIRGVATLGGVAIGTLIALVALGVNITPILAGAGLIGVAVSLASQNIIKDAINGFLIILEDQYALGDVIAVGATGDVTGLVENLNLRITQLRDSEGRLITIPNSEIKIVANLSSRWSRADLSIPVAYNTDIDQALKLIETVALDMDNDPLWQDQILETPKVLGVENFGERGLMIRVWIKTQPLKQWDVAREYRRRLVVAFDQAGIAIPLPQQAVWVNDSPARKSQQFDSRSSS